MAFFDQYLTLVRKQYKIQQPQLQWKMITYASYRMVRDQPNSRKKMRDFTVEFLKCAKLHGKFTEGREIHGKFTGPTALISRCYVNAN